MVKKGGVLKRRIKCRASDESQSLPEDSPERRAADWEFPRVVVAGEEEKEEREGMKWGLDLNPGHSSLWLDNSNFDLEINRFQRS